jgi:hypothetical protein
MDTVVQFSIQQTRFPELKRLVIGDHVFLISKCGVSKRIEVLCNRPYLGAAMHNGEAIHLDFKHTYIFKGKLLQVEAVCKTTYGPLGDRLQLNVWYDGKRIGDYSALRSYMGGGSNGTWPILRDEEGILFFKFSSSKMFGPEKELLIEYYKTVIYDPVELLSTKQKSVSFSKLPEGFLNTELLDHEIVKFKEIEWQIPVLDDLHDTNGALSSFYYEGLDQYYISGWDRKFHLKEPFVSRIFFGNSLDDECVYGISLKIRHETQFHFPWPAMRIYW